MSQEVRTVRFDTTLKVEAYHFQGIMQKFPNHFHEYYVIGFIENGQRYLSCKNQEYTVGTGNLLLFNPMDNHTCEEIGNSTLDYRCINIMPEVMRELSLEITGKPDLPYFTKQVVENSDCLAILKDLHSILMLPSEDLKKEELFYFLLEQLIEEYAPPLQSVATQANPQITAICEYIEKNYASNVSLDDLSTLTQWSKYHLLRTFTKQKGISPYSYLEAIRIGQAKKLLEEGLAPAQVALQTGFSDQSHFTNFFKKFIGLTPKQYMNIFTDITITPKKPS